MKITVLTLWDERYAEAGAISGPNPPGRAATCRTCCKPCAPGLRQRSWL
jgi:hypothetical protein